MYLNDITVNASSPILCYLNAHFGYETSDASNPTLTEEKQMQTDC